MLHLQFRSIQDSVCKAQENPGLPRNLQPPLPPATNSLPGVATQSVWVNGPVPAETKYNGYISGICHIFFLN